MEMKTIFYKSMFGTILEDVGCVRSVLFGCRMCAVRDVGSKDGLEDENNSVEKKKNIYNNNRPCVCVSVFVCKTQDI